MFIVNLINNPLSLNKGSSMNNIDYVNSIQLLPSNPKSLWIPLIQQMQYQKFVSFQFPHFKKHNEQVSLYIHKVHFKLSEMNTKLVGDVKSESVNSCSLTIKGKNLVELAQFIDQSLIHLFKQLIHNSEQVEYISTKMNITYNSLERISLMNNYYSLNCYFMDENTAKNTNIPTEQIISLPNENKFILGFFHYVPFFSSLYIVPEYLKKINNNEYECKYHLEIYGPTAFISAQEDNENDDKDE